MANRVWRRGGLLLALVFWATTASAQIVLEDDLSGSTKGQQQGGQFVSGGGWQAGKQIHWDVGFEVTEGGFSVEVTNWNPDTTSPQHQFAKQHIINMYQAAHGSPHKSDADSPKGGFFNFRTGATYDNLFKFLSSTAGFSPPPKGRYEVRIKRAPGFIDPKKTYTIKVEWTLAGDITAFLDGTNLVTHSHAAPFRLRHVFIGTDNAPAGTYGPQKDVVYKNLKVWGKATPVPDAGAGGSAGSAGAGGNAGAGGSAGTAGAAAGGTSGNAGSGWAANGGIAGSDAGLGGSSGAIAGGTTAEDDPGCGCRAVGSRQVPWAAVLGLALLFALGRRRRDSRP